MLRPVLVATGKATRRAGFDEFFDNPNTHPDEPALRGHLPAVSVKAAASAIVSKFYFMD